MPCDGTLRAFVLQDFKEDKDVLFLKVCTVYVMTYCVHIQEHGCHFFVYSQRSITLCIDVLCSSMKRLSGYIGARVTIKGQH